MNQKGISWLPIIVVAGIVLLLILVGNKNGQNTISTQNFNSETSIQPSSSPEAPQNTPTECLIGRSSFQLSDTTCQAARSVIEKDKQLDIMAVNKVISIINGSIQGDDNYIQQIQGIINDDYQKMGGYPNSTYFNQTCNGNNYNQYIGPSLVYQCKLNTLNSIIKDITYEQNQQKPFLDQKNKFESQKIDYQNYINTIQLAPSGTGNGACSDHGGVDCSAGRGGIGQVICNDGWIDSMVYYFKVKECVDYFVQNLPSSK